MNRTIAVIVASAAALLLAMPAPAHDEHAAPEMTPEQMAEMQAYMQAGTPGAPHEWMASTAGSYDITVKSWHEPGGPPMEETATAVRTMGLEGRVLFEELSGSMMGMPFTGRGMMGYDNVTQEYWSTWTDSMSTGLMLSKGTCDAQKVCSFTGSWNDPIKKGPVTMRMNTRWTNATTQKFEIYGPGKDGKETKMMEMTYSKR